MMATKKLRRSILLLTAKVLLVFLCLQSSFYILWILVILYSFDIEAAAWERVGKHRNTSKKFRTIHSHARFMMMHDSEEPNP